MVMLIIMYITGLLIGLIIGRLRYRTVANSMLDEIERLEKEIKNLKCGK